jgi:hypothetical protein
MRNLVLHDQLRAFAERAAERLTQALEAGAEIPFEVGESPGATSTLYRYRPLSSRFVRERLGELRGLEEYGPVLLALGAVEGLSAYLRALGSSYVPASDRDRAEAVLREFLSRLWEDVTSFELDDRRFERTYRELEAILYENTVVNVVLAPLPTVRLPDERWELGAGLSLARGDSCEAPPQAVWGEGREAGEPATLVLLSAEATPKEPPPLAFARLAFRRLLSALRLLKSGPATLGPTGWWRVDDGPWQPLPLGFAARQRGGPYTLEPADRDDLIELFELVRERPLPGGALPWALSRFEMGCEQAVSLEGLSDHLLALRALLDADEPSQERVSTRLAALCAEPTDRAGLSARVDQAFKLEALLMRGEVDSELLEAAGWGSPDGIALEVEHHLRALLRDMVCGYLEPDVKRIADELLIDEVGAPPAEPVDSHDAEAAVPSGEPGEPPRGEAGEPAIEVTKAPPKRAAKKQAQRSPSGRGKRATPRKGSSQEKHDEEHPTQETAAVGAFGESWAVDDLDWGLDDDPTDFSAAV